MPKRGGGSSQRYNNNVGNGGGRYNAPEDFDDFGQYTGVQENEPSSNLNIMYSYRCGGSPATQGSKQAARQL